MLQAFGLYTHIRRNRALTALLFSGFIFLLHVLAFAGALMFESRAGSVADAMRLAARDFVSIWPALAIGVAVWLGIAFLFQQRMIDFASGANAVSRSDAPELYHALENLCISRGLAMPALKIIDEEGLNAYASGLREKDYSITVTRGLLNALTLSELEAVLGHELTHIRNLDVRLLVYTIIFGGIFGFAANLMFRNIGFPTRSLTDDRNGPERKSGGSAILVVLIAAALVCLSWAVSLLLRFAISRRREFLADAGSVELTKNPDAMISALRKIEMHASLPAIPAQMSAFFIEAPDALQSTSWLDTHPTISERIDALIRFAGGHDPGPMPDLTSESANPSRGQLAKAALLPRKSALGSLGLPK